MSRETNEAEWKEWSGMQRALAGLVWGPMKIKEVPGWADSLLEAVGDEPGDGASGQDGVKKDAVVGDDMGSGPGDGSDGEGVVDAAGGGG